MDLYKDIEGRTNGEIYIGVVGPVRTGKSTFIKKFMDLFVIPAMEDIHSRERTKDELPQSAAGRTVMTTEPKFIPKEAANIILSNDVSLKVRLIDCVGYMVDGATGHMENEQERMVKTPWFDYSIPFTKAAEIGTKKVINDHSTIGIVLTTDGSFGDIEREKYIVPEQRTILELKAMGKPFIVVVNSSEPDSERAKKTVSEIEEKYKVTAVLANCINLSKDDIKNILFQILNEFPVSKMEFFMPGFAEMIPANHEIKQSIINTVRSVIKDSVSMKDIQKEKLDFQIAGSQYIENAKIIEKDLATGAVKINITIHNKYYFQVVSELTGQQIESEYQLIRTIKNLSDKKTEYEKVANAIEQVAVKGYGVVMPSRDEIILGEPEIIKSGTGFGVKIKAEAPSVHMIKANIMTELAPIVGDESQARDLINFINENGRDGMDGIWNTNIFGKTIEQIVTDGIRTKIERLSDETQAKMQDTIKKITNESRGGVICIIL